MWVKLYKIENNKQQRGDAEHNGNKMLQYGDDCEEWTLINMYIKEKEF